ncbi:MAG: phenylacetate--CoA ligase family protein, partial [Desulfovibrio sp.]|nr:phenylacetate--CoA ligase family protein [Desulfovibrio sp.]
HAVDHLLLTVERTKGLSEGGDEALKHSLAESLHKSILARIDVSITEYASLPRTFSKSKRVVDKRYGAS